MSFMNSTIRCTKAWKAQFLSGLMMPVLNFVSNLGYVGVCVLGGYLATKQIVEIGDIQAFIQYVLQLQPAITQTANMANLLQSTIAAAERVFVFLEEEEEPRESEHPVKLDHVEGKVEFDHVVFGYNEDKVIIKDFNATVQPEQKVAIVGPTGAGKTTMVNLLMRFYDVNSGRHSGRWRQYPGYEPGRSAFVVWHGFFRIRGYSAEAFETISRMEN